MERNFKWHYIKEEGMPKVKGDKPKVFLIAYRQELVDLVCTINNKPFYEPNGKYMNVTQVALLQNHESMDGVYTPKNKFYWGPDIFDNAYAWAEFPEAPEYKG